MASCSSSTVNPWWYPYHGRVKSVKSKLFPVEKVGSRWVKEGTAGILNIDNYNEEKEWIESTQYNGLNTDTDPIQTASFKYNKGKLIIEDALGAGDEYVTKYKYVSNNEVHYKTILNAEELKQKGGIYLKDGRLWKTVDSIVTRFNIDGNDTTYHFKVQTTFFNDTLPIRSRTYVINDRGDTISKLKFNYLKFDEQKNYTKCMISQYNNPRETDRAIEERELNYFKNK
jgi:hypothetical protein